MPLYSYRCLCGEKSEAFRSVSKRNDAPLCACGLQMERDIIADHRSPRNASCGEIVSVNGGVMPRQIPQAQKMFGDLGIKFNKRGDAIAPDRNSYLKYLHRRGLVNGDEIRGGH